MPSRDRIAAPAPVRLPALSASHPSALLNNSHLPRGGAAGFNTTAPSTAVAVSPSSSSSPFVLFADLPNQLLCAPDNSIWVYSQYTLSFFTSEAAAQAKLEKKVRSMMREAQRHYDISCAFFHSLNPEEQMAEVLRAGGAGGGVTPTPSSAVVPTSGSATPTTTAAAVESVERDHQRRLHIALRKAWPMRDASDEAELASGSAPDEEDGSMPMVYAPGLRVNLVVDLVASRKTLGPTPLRSRPYRLAENLYRLLLHSKGTELQGPSVALATTTTLRTFLPELAPHVRTVVVGISDTDSTLVGSHMVCPYKHLPTPSPTLLRLRRAIQQAADHFHERSLPDAATSAASSRDDREEAPGPAMTAETVAAVNAAYRFSNFVGAQLARYRRLDALLPAPYMRVPPSSLAQIDQTRHILCAPPMVM